jgi:hypothetical protein
MAYEQHTQHITIKVQKLEELLEKNIPLFLERGGNLVCREYGNREENKACALNTIRFNDGLEPVGVGLTLQNSLFDQTNISYSQMNCLHSFGDLMVLIYLALMKTARFSMI